MSKSRLGSRHFLTASRHICLIKTTATIIFLFFRTIVTIFSQNFVAETAKKLKKTAKIFCKKMAKVSD